MTVPDGHVEGGPSVMISVGNRGGRTVSLLLDEELDHGQVTRRTGRMEGGVPSGVGRLDVGPPLNQKFGNLALIPLAGPVERGWFRPSVFLDVHPLGEMDENASYPLPVAILGRIEQISSSVGALAAVHGQQQQQRR
mmetsp:Transcript_30093/g.82660  ORF Transcript_30093/g.82660 Transcript_30093/m.82660 type:complete len:137 (+) Transcript_30093:1978-2388(+)